MQSKYFQCRSLVGLIVVMVLEACSSSPKTKEDVLKDAQAAAAIATKMENKAAEQRQERAQDYISVMPKWVLDPPKPDGTGVYAVGIAESAELRIALRKAMLEAEFGLAKLFKQEISGSERQFDQERQNQGNMSQFTGLIDKLVARVPVVGFEIIQQEVRPIRGQYHTWVLLKLPYAQFNKVLQEQKAESMDQSIKDAFDDLDKRIKSRQEERQRELLTLQAMRIQQSKAIESSTQIPTADQLSKAAPAESSATPVGAKQ